MYTNNLQDPKWFQTYETLPTFYVTIQLKIKLIDTTYINKIHLFSVTYHLRISQSSMFD